MNQEEILTLLRTEGPMTLRQIVERAGEDMTKYDARKRSYALRLASLKRYGMADVVDSYYHNGNTTFVWGVKE